MKVAIFSDIHGNLEALEAILEDIKKNQFDEVICLGDVIGIGPSPKECLRKIQEANIKLLLGNHERCYLIKDDTLSVEEQKHYQWINSVLGEEYKSYLNSCALSYKIQDVLFEHFIIEDETKVNPFVGLSDEKVISSKIKEVDAKLIFVGHQHRPFLADKMICIGSSGCTKNNKTFYYSIDIGDTVQYDKCVLRYDRYAFEEKMKQLDYPSKSFVARGFFGILE